MTLCTIHLLGHPNLPLDIDAFPEDAQVRTCFLFCELLRHLKIPFFYYGIAGSRIPDGGEFVPLGKPTGKWSWRNAWHVTYTKRATRALRQHILPHEPQIVASLYGAAHADIDCGELPVMEPMLGYNHCWAPYRVFPSRAHQNVIYATCPKQTQDTHQNDVVIPHFLLPKDYPQSRKFTVKNYLLYLGRPVVEKGIEVAQECARLAGVPLRMEHSGWKGAAKARLLTEALAVLTPTLYPEPFGYVAIESQMCGTPVLASDWGAFPETVLPSRTGFLCRTPRQFADAVSSVRLLDRGFIRKSAIQRFSLENIAPHYENYFKFVLDSHQNHPCFPKKNEIFQ